MQKPAKNHSNDLLLLNNYMTLSKNSRCARFYCKSYGTNKLPSSLCDFFWALVWLICLLPLTWPSYIPKGNEDNIKDRAKCGIIMYILAFSFFVPGIMITAGHDNQTGIWFWMWSFIWAVFIWGLVAFFVLFSGLIAHFFEKRRRNRVYEETPKEKTPSVLIEYIKAVKAKHCPIINWED